MRILLIGEYSRLHNSLKEGLLKLGHEVKLLGDGDSFKNYPVDFSIRPKTVDANWFMKKLRIGLYILTTIDLMKIEHYLRFLPHKRKLKGFDVVQFINSNALKTPLFLQKRQLRFLERNNKNLFLCACGTDTPIVEYLLQGKMKDHILVPYLQKEYPKKRFKFCFDYIAPRYKSYFAFFERRLKAIFPSDMDYFIPLKDHPKVSALFPNPVNTDKLQAETLPPIRDKIIVFLGINESSYITKGSRFFEEALEIIEKKYPGRVKTITARSLPYGEYIQLYKTAHILLDMVYAYDQGYNALEAMAKGKVVFTGAETEFLEHYGLSEDEVCINAKPDVDYLIKKLSWLIDKPSKIAEIGKNAQKFVRREHDYVQVARQYVDAWNN